MPDPLGIQGAFSPYEGFPPCCPIIVPSLSVSPTKMMQAIVDTFIDEGAVSYRNTI